LCYNIIKESFNWFSESQFHTLVSTNWMTWHSNQLEWERL